MASNDPQDRKIPSAVGRALAASARDLTAWRKLRGLTQLQLADRAGIGLNTLRRLESGDGSVSLENTLRVVRALGILDAFSRALDPYESDVGRLRSDERLPERVHPRRLD
jgi:transcriptional regulator with XRE-family HTH domain